MRFTFFLCLAGSLVFSGVGYSGDKPNIVMILADDLGINDLGCYGRTAHKTPNLDRLAAEGKRFTTAYAQAVCSPSRSALLTGQHPARLLITNFLPGRADWPGHRLLQPPLPAGLATDRPTLAERLKELGYATGMTGKWHLGSKAPFLPAQRGFDMVFAGKANTAPSDTEGGKGEFAQTDKAIEFMEANAKRPFFLYMAYDNPHVPLAAQPDRIAANSAGFNPLYDAVVETLDVVVGRVLEKLDALGLKENTMVVFASDNGGLHVPEIGFSAPTHNTPYRAGKGFLYEGGIRDPFIVRWSGKVTPSVVDVPVSIADFAPTVLDILGAAPVVPGDFVSLKPLLLGDGQLPERALFWHMPNYTNQGGRPSGAIREGDWKLIEHYEDGRLELFDLKADPSEKNDVSANEAKRVATMRGKLEAWRRSLDAQMPKPNPKYQPVLGNACYVATDVSKLEALKTAAEMDAPLKAWREAMDKGSKKGEWETGDAVNGLVMLEARSADVHSGKLKYEPQPNKDTLGYWVDAADWVSWECEVPAAGRYAVEVLQGCGKGSGGSSVDLSVGNAVVRFRVEDTGDFQRFVPRQIGVVDVPPGKTTVTVKVAEKKGGAVMDLRRVTLIRVP
ncbi:MAG: sulfatase-like hydrolase/transferase [Verrucomicrobiota bacterium]